MSQRNTSLLSQCPICGRNETIVMSEKLFGYLRRILPCPTCGATLVRSGRNSYKLSYCAPHKLGQQGCKRCSGHFYSTCFLDKAFSLSDWERMAQRKAPIEVEEFLDRTRRLESGELPVVEISTLSEKLLPGEVVHYFSEPVFTDDWHHPGRTEDGGKLYVTNRRLLLCSPEACESLPFEGFEELEEEYPGFYVKLRWEKEPRHFFPPSLDPVFSALLGALKNFQQSEETPRG